MGRLPLIDEDVTAGRLAIAVDRPVPVSSGYWLVKPPGIETRREIVAFRNWLLKEMSQLNWNRQIFDIIKESCILAMLPAILPTTIFRIWRQKSQAPWQLGRCSRAGRAVGKRTKSSPTQSGRPVFLRSYYRATADEYGQRFAQKYCFRLRFGGPTRVYLKKTCPSPAGNRASYLKQAPCCRVSLRGNRL